MTYSISIPAVTNVFDKCILNHYEMLAATFSEHCNTSCIPLGQGGAFESRFYDFVSCFLSNIRDSVRSIKWPMVSLGICCHISSSVLYSFTR